MLSKTIVMAALLAGSFCAQVQAANPSLPRQTAAKAVPDSIDLTKIPYSEKELAAFPIFDPPTDIVPLNKPLIRDFDRLFFPTKQGMIPLEGKVYKSFMTSATGKEWSLPFFEKSYRDLIIAAGGVLIYQGKVAEAELERIKNEAEYFGEEGSIDYTNTVVKVYAIRRKEGDHVFVQFSGYSAGGSIQILQLPKKEK